MPQVTQSSIENETGIGERPLPSSDNQLCAECRQPLQVGATRCGHCGVSQKTWLRRIMLLGIMLGALLSVFSLTAIAFQISDFVKDAVGRDVNFAISSPRCTQDQYRATLWNLETDQPLKLESLQLVAVNGEPSSIDLIGGTASSRSEIDELLPVGLPWSVEFYRGGFTFDHAILDCAVCNLDFEVTVARFNGSRPTTKTFSCQAVGASH